MLGGAGKPHALLKERVLVSENRDVDRTALATGAAGRG
ncbi:hypothetical protein NAP1_12013 [Erythrobacter sp. NAP1]|nr:hypothetical protein NAP1_12013 [Erythrobacter sp. NAP1]